MKKLLILNIIFFCAHADQFNKEEHYIQLMQNLQKNAEKILWQDNQLNPTECQFLLNYFCASYALVFSEVKLLEESQFILPMAWHLRFNNEKLFMTPENLKFVQRSLKRTQQFLDARETLRDALDMFDHELNKPTYTKLLNVVNNMVAKSAIFIESIAALEIETIQKNLYQANTDLNDTSSTKNILAWFTNELSANPLAISPLETTELAADLIEELGKEIKKTMELTERLTNDRKDLFIKSSLVFYVFYKTLYDGMKKQNLEQTYFTMLFKENSVIAQDPVSKGLVEPILDRTLPFFNTNL